MKNVLIFVVAYNAEKFIESVLERIPAALWADERFNVECLIIDDASPDQTFERAKQYAQRRPELKITVMYNPVNQGYGGNQKLGYLYAIQNDYDVVVMLHGDGQYAPEYLLQMVEPILNGDSDVVLGSRMIDKKSALQGKMPLYKWIGNQALTTMQNWMLGSNLAEFHTGYRAYSVPALASVPFTSNADYFDFDTDILIQMISTHKRIKEISVPTFYGEEISHVNSWRYGLLILRSTLLAKLMPFGIYYHPKFDYERSSNYYTAKFGFPSSHQYALEHVTTGSTVLDLGNGPSLMAEKLAEKQVKTIEASAEAYAFETDDAPIDTILLLDVIEHLKMPEALLARLRERYSGERPEIIITTANIAFLPMRLSLLFGQFNYSKKGILDKDHARLFTFATLRRILRITGYDVIEERGIPIPFPLIIKNKPLQQVLIRLNEMVIWLWKGLFAYQIAVRARPRPTVNYLLQTARTTGEKRWDDHLALIVAREPELSK